MPPIAPALLVPERLKLDFAAKSETDAINEVAALLAEAPGVLDFEQFRSELFSREKLSPTSLGSGVAFPHARTAAVTEIVMAIGRSREGVFFERCSEKIHLIFVIGTPKESVREYLGLLASLAALLRQSAVREKLMQAETEADFVSALRGG